MGAPHPVGFKDEADEQPWQAVKLPWHIPFIFTATFIIHHLDRNVLAFSIPQIATEFGWNDRQVGEWGEYLLGAFFLTFGASQITLSGLAERLGAKRIILMAIFGFSMVSILMGSVASSVLILVSLRLLLGLAESMHVPMMSVMISRIFPVNVRATANAIWNIGLIIATALGSAILVPLISRYGWHATFLIVGSAGLLIGFPLVLFFVPAYEKRSVARQANEVAVRGKFRRLPAYWMFVVAGVLNAFSGFGILGWLPTYFVRAKNIDFKALGWPLSIVFAAGVLGMLVFAWLGDRLRIRITLAAVGMVVSGFSVFLARAADHVPGLVALFALAMFAQSTFGAQEMSTVQLIARDTEVGAATGLYNGTSVLLGGVFGSMVPGLIIAATGSFDMALLSIAGGSAVSGLLMGWLSFRHPELN